jgi:two-component system alkaline phosphatase synthesis response regulator PhoP
MAKKILIIDDEPSASNLYKERFEFSEFEVKQAWAGEGSVKMAEEFQPSVILLDLMLPQMSGEEVLDQLRSNPKTKNIPVIVWTALFQQEAERAKVEQKADDYVIKTEIMPGELVKKVEELMNKPANPQTDK